MAAPEPRARVQFVPDQAGLAVARSVQRIDFGRAPSGVMSVLDRELGRHQALSLTGCPEDVVQRLDWSGLELSFSAERFVGWRQGNAQAGRVCG